MKKEDFNVLVVDDEPKLRGMFKEYFELFDYNVLTASGGNEALEMVKDSIIHFVVSDVQMPEGDGEELLVELRKRNPDVPTIVMVSGFSKLTKEKAIELGAKDLLTKPVNLDQLEGLISNEYEKLAAI
jgi:two-component system response regulator AtoC